MVKKILNICLMLLFGTLAVLVGMRNGKRPEGGFVFDPDVAADAAKRADLILTLLFSSLTLIYAYRVVKSFVAKTVVSEDNQAPPGRMGK